jgi:uncharacterized protein (UPF0303 family)
MPGRGMVLAARRKANSYYKALCNGPSPGSFYWMQRKQRTIQRFLKNKGISGYSGMPKYQLAYAAAQADAGHVNTAQNYLSRKGSKAQAHRFSRRRLGYGAKKYKRHVARKKAGITTSSGR